MKLLFEFYLESFSKNIGWKYHLFKNKNNFILHIRLTIFKISYLGSYTLITVVVFEDRRDERCTSITINYRVYLNVC